MSCHLLLVGDVGAAGDVGDVGVVDYVGAVGDVGDAIGPTSSGGGENISCFV